MAGINCSKCGRWVGKDGFYDVFYDDYSGGWEEGYSLCAQCLKTMKDRNEKRIGLRNEIQIQIPLSEI